jgi:hypothetical protein
MKISLLLDSGAFSAWTRKTPVDIDAYISFIQEYKDQFEYYVNLDCIPGEWGRKPSRDEIEKSAQKGYENYHYMLSKGIPKERLIHVFHQHEDWKWLKKMVQEIPYIGLSPANDSSQDSKQRWLDECMQYTTDSRGYPLVKTHGFAVTSVSLMYRYPWFSADSMSWRMCAGYGSVFVPTWNMKGEFVYDRTPLVIKFTSKGGTSQAMVRAFDYLSAHRREKVAEYIHSKGFVIGSSEVKDGEEHIVEEGLCNSHRHRELMNILYFQDFLSRLEPFPHRRYRGKDLSSQEFSFV